MNGLGASDARRRVMKTMLAHVAPATVILSADGYYHARLLGLGTYVRAERLVGLVSRRPDECPAAAGEIACDMVGEAPGDDWRPARALSLDRFDGGGPPPATGELLFFCGHVQNAARFGFGAGPGDLAGYATSRLGPGETASSLTVAWTGEDRAELDGQDRDHSGAGIDDPSGFQGALVWNTRYVETLAKGEAWSVDHAIVTGMITTVTPPGKPMRVLRAAALRRAILAALDAPGPAA